MREETRLKFEREVRKQWIKRGAIAAAVVAAIAGAAWFQGLDSSVHNQPASGTILRVDPVAGFSSQMIQNGLNVDVKLDDGREVQVLVLKNTKPEVGQHVSITEHVHGSGRSTFTWK